MSGESLGRLFWDRVAGSADRPAQRVKSGGAWHDMPWRAGQYAVFALWLVGVPWLAAGLALQAAAAVRAAAWCLAAATLLDSAQAAIVVRHAFTRSAHHSWRRSSRARRDEPRRSATSR